MIALFIGMFIGFVVYSVIVAYHTPVVKNEDERDDWMTGF